MIEFSSRAWQLGDEIVIRARGLEPGARYALRVARRVRGQPHASVIEAVADDAGVVETTRDPDLPFWSMRRVAEPVDDGVIECSLSRDRETVHGRLAIASPYGVEVGDGLIGRWFAADPRAAVIVLGGSDGGLDGAIEYAAALAGRGLGALALAYFGMPGLPEQLAGIALESVGRAIAWLRGNGIERVGIVGRSRGGELALLVASKLGGVAAVVAHSASTFAWNGAWTHGGVTLPHLSVRPADVDVSMIEGNPVMSPVAAFRAALARATPAELAAARIPIAGPTLLMCGDDDAVWPAAQFAAAAGDAEVHVFPEAGHRATLLPGDPTTEATTVHPTGPRVRHGGTPQGDARAQRAGWDLAIAFLRRQMISGHGRGLMGR